MVQGILGLVLVLLSSNVAAQICKTDKPLPPEAGRYQINADGTVLDKTLGLQWQRCAYGAQGAQCEKGQAVRLTAMQAWEQGVRLNQSKWLGFNDWRVPTIKELESLRKADCVDPAIDVTLFPATGSHWYWSSSTEPGDQFTYWYLDFKDGFVAQDDKNLANPVRFVRNANKIK